MKPTKQQLKLLQNYLHSTLNYRETYEEIYDHILSALEFQPDDVPFQDAINNIIRTDFGGPGNLLKVERTSKNALVKDCLRKFTGYFVHCFNFPALLYTLSFGFVSYYFLSKLKLEAFTIEGMFAVTVVLPGVTYLLLLYNTGYILDTTKKSAKDKLFETLASIPLRVFVVLIIFVNTSFYKVWATDNYYSVTVLLLLAVIYNVVLFKLYKNEFNTAAIAK